MKKTVSPEFRALMLSTYPALESQPAYLRLFNWLCFGTYLADVPGCPINPLALPHKYLARINEADPTHFRSGPFLEAFKRDVLPDLAWDEWIPPSYSSSGRTRYVTNYGFSSEVETAIQAELHHQGPKIYFHSGNKENPFYLRELRKEEQAANAKLLSDLNNTQQLILGVLNQNNGKGTLERTKKFASQLNSALETLGDRSQAHQRRVIASIREDSKVLYYPSARTCRLHANWGSVCQLKKQLRHILCQGWMEVDLVSSQFAILSAILNAPLCRAFVKSQQDLWTYLNLGTKPDAITKGHLKSFMYALCFGDSRGGLGKKAKLAGRGASHSKPLLHDALIQELLQVRDPWLAQITHSNQIADVWGTVHQDRKASSLAATLIQSIEMELVASSFEIAEGIYSAHKAVFQLFQHDGFTLSIGDPRFMSELKQKLQDALSNKAQKIGQQLGIDLSGVRYSFDHLPEINQ